MIHYASREAGYGPLVSNSEGLHYFTLRARSDSGAWYLPKFKDQMQSGLKKRQDTVGPIQLLQGPLHPDRAEVQTVIELTDTGLGAWAVQGIANLPVSPPSPAVGGGRFYVVIDGEVTYEGQRLPSLACVFVSADENTPEFLAGPEGARLLVLQLPESAIASPTALLQA